VADLGKNKWGKWCTRSHRPGGVGWVGGVKGTKWRLEIIYSHRSGEQHTVIILATWKVLDSARYRYHTEDIQF
jgi:hypothetical protein